MTKWAEQSGLSQGWVSRIMNRTVRGDSPPTPNISDGRKLAAAMRVDIGCLYRALARADQENLVTTA